MSFGEKISVLRKKKGFSQDELAKKVGLISITIGRYERDEIKPSVDVAARIAAELDTSLDYLTGGADAVLEKSLVNKIAAIQRLPTDDRDTVMKLIDAFLRDSTAKHAYAS